jgi:hypothetical protein
MELPTKQAIFHKFVQNFTIRQISGLYNIKPNLVKPILMEVGRMYQSFYNSNLGVRNYTNRDK